MRRQASHSDHHLCGLSTLASRARAHGPALFRLSNCKLHGFDPQAYFADVLNKLVNLWPASRLDELMPWA
jgi:hypothetical protein